MDNEVHISRKVNIINSICWQTKEVDNLNSLFDKTKTKHSVTYMDCVSLKEMPENTVT